MPDCKCNNHWMANKSSYINYNRADVSVCWSAKELPGQMGPCFGAVGWNNFGNLCSRKGHVWPSVYSLHQKPSILASCYIWLIFPAGKERTVAVIKATSVNLVSSVTLQEPVTGGVLMRTPNHSPSAFKPLNQPLTSLYGRVPRWRKAPSFCLHSPSFFWRTTDLQPSSMRDIPTSRWMCALSIQGQNVAGIRGKWPPLRVL